MSDVDLLYSGIEDELRTAVRSAVADRATPAALLEAHEKYQPYDPELWRTLAAAMALGGIAVPEEHHGAGGGWREAAVVLEELGRAVAPVPFLGHAVVAAAAVLACGDAELLDGLAAAAPTVALAVPFSTPPYAYGAPGAAAAPRGIGGGISTEPSAGGGAALTGTVTSVADALAADVLLVPAGDALYAVDVHAEGVIRTPVTSLDLTRQLCDVTLTGVPGRLVALGEQARSAVATALSVGAGLLASEQLGVAEWCLETTVAYLKERHQFGRPIGSFQALRHRAAALWVAVTEARAAARYAAACLAADDPDAPVAVAVAQAFCSETAVTAAEECVQLHGGIGFTWEHPAHLYLKRAKTTAAAFGTPGQHRAALAHLADLPAAF